MHYQAAAKTVLISLLAVLAGCTQAPRIGKLQPVDEAAFRRLVQSGRGQVTLINFWATWCAPCRAEMPNLVRLEAKLQSRGFRLVTVSADEPEQETEALNFLKEHWVHPPAFIKRPVSDEAFITAVDPKWSGALPASFLFDRSGQKVRAFTGEVDMASLEAAIRKLL